MKKTLTFAMLGLVASASSMMAAYQFGDYVDYDYQNNNVQDRTLTVVQDSSLTLDFISSPYNSGTPGYSISEWDTLNVQVTDGTTGQMTFRDVAITGTSIDIGDFVAGDSLFFYVTGSQGSTTTTIEKHIGYQVWDTANNTPDSLFFDGNYGNWNSKYAQLTFRVSGGAAQSPSGQPLPGVAVSMLMGSAGLYLVKRKKAAAVAR